MQVSFVILSLITFVILVLASITIFLVILRETFISEDKNGTKSKWTYLPSLSNS